MGSEQIAATGSTMRHAAMVAHHVFPHRHPKHLHTEPSFGQVAADRVASAMGSWTFIIAQTLAILLWISLNVIAVVNHWDPYPFILLNLLFSTQAAYAAPIIMMSQNRAAEIDRAHAENAYMQTAEIDQLQHQQMEILAKQEETLREVHELSRVIARCVGESAPATSAPSETWCEIYAFRLPRREEGVDERGTQSAAGTRRPDSLQ